MNNPEKPPVAGQDPVGPATADEATPESAQQPAGEELERLGSKVKELEEELVKTRDAYMRAIAEAENVRRRAARERQDMQRYAAADPLKEILGVADNLRRALDSVPQEERGAHDKLATVLEGVEATERQLMQALEKHGVRRVEALGKPFDHRFHEAMFEVEDPQSPSGTVVQELAPGYVLHDRLLRPAMVGIAKGGLAREPGGEEAAAQTEETGSQGDPYAGGSHRAGPNFDTNA
ncbi:MAG: nucleotide exchange factor GrpE [Acetobacterales bacterium]